MIILASTSTIRQQLLSQAGIEFKSLPAPFDEEQAKRGSAAVNPRDLAAAMALGKAQATSVQYMEALVIGADKTLEIDGAVLHKPKSREEAGQQLAMLRGRSHNLHSALAITKGNSVLYQTVSNAQLKMRAFSDSFLQHYLAHTSASSHASVGCYQLESLGVQLFDHVEGDYFTILGLPLLPLLAFLRESGEIQT
jgi:septum formation protein